MLQKLDPEMFFGFKPMIERAFGNTNCFEDFVQTNGVKTSFPHDFLSGFDDAFFGM